MIKLLCFDLDDTLYDNKPLIKKAEASLRHELATIFARHQREFLDENLRTIRQQTALNDPVVCENLTEWRRRTLQSLLHFIASDHERGQLVERLLQKFIHERSDIVVDERIVDLLKALSKNYQLVAITNGNVNFPQLNIATLFTHYYSPTQGYRAKPHPQMLEQALARHSVAPEQCVLIGDSVKKDGEAARKAGVHFIPFAPFSNGQLILGRLQTLQRQLKSLN